MWEELEWRYRNEKTEDQRSRHEKFPAPNTGTGGKSQSSWESSHDIHWTKWEACGKPPPPCTATAAAFVFIASPRAQYSFLPLVNSSPSLTEEGFWKTEFQAVERNSSPAELTTNSAAVCP